MQIRDMFKSYKQQSALEFMITYSWAIVIITLFLLMVLILSDTRPPINYLGSSCNIQPLLPCQQTLLTYNAITPLEYYMVFTNQLGTVMYMSANGVNSINLTTSGIGIPGIAHSLGNCNPSIVGVGATVLCTVLIPGSAKPGIGTQASVSFIISYELCSSGNPNSCKGGIYKTSGYSLQNLAPSSVSINNLEFVTSPGIGGTILINGVAYYNMTSGYFLSGNYVLYASANTPSYVFNHWSITGPNALLSNTLNNTDMLALYSNAIVTANFIAHP